MALHIARSITIQLNINKKSTEEAQTSYQYIQQAAVNLTD